MATTQFDVKQIGEEVRARSEPFRLLLDQRDVQAILRYPWPDPDDPGFTAGLPDRVRWIKEHTLSE